MLTKKGNKAIIGNNFVKLLFSLFLFGVSVFFASEIRGANFVVNDVGDSIDDVPGNGICADIFGKCTLRAAIQEANALLGNDSISFNLPTPSNILISIGRLNITSNISISGLGPRNLTVLRSTVAGTPNFGVFFVQAFDASISDIAISNGNVNGNGGGIGVFRDSFLTLNHVAVSGNSADSSGGGIHNRGTLNVINSNIDSNHALRSGGGISNSEGGSANIANTTISNNSAGNSGFDEGGGIHSTNSIVLNNVTVSNNSAADSAGGIRNFGGIWMRNTIVANNTAPANPDVSGSFCGVGNHSMGNNLIGNGNGSTCLINGIDGDIVGSNALLGSLGNNGGPTNTFSLLVGSPAIDAGSSCVLNSTCPIGGGASTNPIFPLVVDQRGFLRPVGGAIDMGAFEVQPLAVTLSGRILTASNSIVRNAFISLTNTATSETRVTLTNPFGYYRFLLVPNGQTYTLSVRHKRYSFVSQTVTIQGERNDLNFTPTP